MLRNAKHAVFLFTQFIGCYCSINDDVNITEIVYREGIVPDVISGPPRELLRCYYEFGELRPGAVLNMYQCKRAPRMNWTHDKNRLYTTMMIGVTKWNQSRHLKRPFCRDPTLYATTKSPPKYRQSLQWMVNNVPATDIHRGEENRPFIPSIHVLERTIPERFIFLVYEQPSFFDMVTIEPRYKAERMSPATKPVAYNVLDYILNYLFRDQNPIALNYWDAEVFSKELPEFDSRDYHLMYEIDKKRAALSSKGYKFRDEFELSVDYDILNA